VPLTIRPALRSMSPGIRSNIWLFGAILIDGVGFAPKTEPRPVMKQTTVAPRR
jgi:hypothetical protein